MNTKAQTILKEARSLPRDEQLEIAEQVLAALEIDSTDPDAELLPELEQRWAAHENGDDPGEEATSAIADIRSLIRNNKLK